MNRDCALCTAGVECAEVWLRRSNNGACRKRAAMCTQRAVLSTMLRIGGLGCSECGCETEIFLIKPG